MSQKIISLSKVNTLVLDEADRMLDMGFINDMKKIIAKIPRERQTLLFSATLSNSIVELASSILRKPKRIAVATTNAVADNLSQSVYFVDQKNKKDLLIDTLRELQNKRVLVFTRTKHRANRLAQQLEKSGIKADAIHSNKSQNARRRILAAFDAGEVKTLIATDVVARGIDVKEISHVINFDLPDDPENYVHRIGRTARAKHSGAAYSFCCSEEVDALKLIVRLTKKELEVVEDSPYHLGAVNLAYLDNSRPPRRRGRQGGASSGNGARQGDRRRSQKRRPSNSSAASDGRSSGNRGRKRSSGRRKGASNK